MNSSKETLIRRVKASGDTRVFLAFLLLWLVPPCIFAELFIEPFTNLGLIPPMGWTLYLFMGMLRLPNPKTLTDVLWFSVWPFRKSTLKTKVE